MHISFAKALTLRIKDDEKFRRSFSRLLLWTTAFAPDEMGSDGEIRKRLWKAVDMDKRAPPPHYWVSIRDVALICTIFGKDELLTKIDADSVSRISKVMVESMNISIAEGSGVVVSEDGAHYKLSRMDPDSKPGNHPVVNPDWLESEGIAFNASTFLSAREFIRLHSRAVREAVELRAGSREREKSTSPASSK
jgi:hypothetical protein